MRISPDTIKAQIAGLLLQFPEMAEDEQLRVNSIEGETDAFEFLATVVRQIEDTKAMSEGIGLRVKELSERAARFDRRVEALRSLAFKIMQTADIRKVELPCATLSVRNGSPKVVITDEAELPTDAFRIKQEPDRQAIKAKLDAGEEVPGAMLSNAEPTLSIRVK